MSSLFQDPLVARTVVGMDLVLWVGITEVHSEGSVILRLILINGQGEIVLADLDDIHVDWDNSEETGSTEGEEVDET